MQTFMQFDATPTGCSCSIERKLKSVSKQLRCNVMVGGRNVFRLLRGQNHMSGIAAHKSALTAARQYEVEADQRASQRP